MYTEYETNDIEKAQIKIEFINKIFYKKFNLIFKKKFFKRNFKIKIFFDSFLGIILTQKFHHSSFDYCDTYSENFFQTKTNVLLFTE